MINNHDLRNNFDHYLPVIVQPSIFSALYHIFSTGRAEKLIYYISGAFVCMPTSSETQNKKEKMSLIGFFRNACLSAQLACMARSVPLC